MLALVLLAPACPCCVNLRRGQRPCQHVRPLAANFHAHQRRLRHHIAPRARPCSQTLSARAPLHQRHRASQPAARLFQADANLTTQIRRRQRSWAPNHKHLAQPMHHRLAYACSQPAHSQCSPACCLKRAHHPIANVAHPLPLADNECLLQLAYVTRLCIDPMRPLRPTSCPCARTFPLHQLPYARATAPMGTPII